MIIERFKKYAVSYNTEVLLLAVIFDKILNSKLSYQIFILRTS